MPDQAWTTAEVEVEFAAIVAGTPVGLGVDGNGWQAFVVNWDGSPIRTLDVAVWGDLEERIADPASITIGLDASNTSQLADVQLITTRVQIYEDAKLRFWGLVIARRAKMNDPIIEVDLVDLSWLLTRRLCNGDPLTGNLSRNSGFELDFSRWKHHNASIDSTVYLQGTRSAKMTTLGAYISQQTVIDRAGTFAVTARVRIDNATFVAADAESGLEVGAMAYTGVGGGRDVYADDIITSSTTRDNWITLAATITLPTDGPWTMWWKFHGVNGDLNVDSVKVMPFLVPRRTEAAGIFPPTDAPTSDTGRLAREIVSGSVGNLGFSVLGTDSGVEITDEVGTWDDKYAWEALDVLRRLENPLDWSLLLTPTTFTVRIWTPASSRGGVHAFTLTTTHVLEASSSEDGSQARNHARVMSDGGFRVDSYSSGWDITLDEVVQAPSGTPASELDGVGGSHLGNTTGRVTALDVTVCDGPDALRDSLELADRLPVDATVGGLAGAGSVRIVAITRHTRTPTMRLTLERI